MLPTKYKYIPTDFNSQHSFLVKNVNLYQNEYKSLDFSPLFELYNSKYQLNKSEILLLLSKLALIDKLTFNKLELENTINTKYLIDYVNKTIEFISKYNKED